RAQPDARILLSSQSNVAVNHALSRVAELRATAGATPLEILRIGRADKIGQGAEVWMLEQRLAGWRSQIQAHMDQVIPGLAERARTLQRLEALAKELSPQMRADLGECVALLERLAQDVEQRLAQDVEQRLAREAAAAGAKADGEAEVHD